MDKIYKVYILESEQNNKYYIGVTSDLERRIKEHNSGYSKSTCAYRPWKIVRTEKFTNIYEAYNREKYLKSLKKRSYIEKIIKLEIER